MSAEWGVALEHSHAIATRRCAEYRGSGLGMGVARATAMKRQPLLGMCLAVLSYGLVSEAGGVNKFVATWDHGDGFLRVQKTRSDTLLSDFRMPKLTGVTTCKADGWRVMSTGPKEAPRDSNGKYVKNEYAHQWDVATARLTLADQPASTTSHRKSKIDQACAAGHAAVMVPIKESGSCKNEHGVIPGGMDYFYSTRSIPFGLECIGYATSKQPIYLFRHNRKIASKMTAVFNADAGGKSMLASREAKQQSRQSVEGQLWTQGGAGMRAIYRMTQSAPDGLRETLASHPTTVANLERRGYKKAGVAGYVKTSGGAGTMPLYSYFLASSQDAATVAMTDSVKMLTDRGYELTRVEGYVATIPNL